ncbi:MAG: 5'/3'-nucleotidase SurE [Proteobacteria bacterium]|jgi:5'-nucleotidase|uniref:5'-nucleotidase SurE n=1 Tax=SAR86 cluster bacterium TaxID=2030880 RepID=A0A937LH38_9GAMM|nr:5'/3'-nucleotidase SurE [SAR86 cluster bacterium]MDA0775465.1 5'/3'-nucleotidase SurE [Pseudomonadota bacterium]MDA0976417.1 5'/3'-nucleotidase SurE [Pseudomonadota bacterium]MDA1037712.1 5'/3'-nucleotidase SurE [Pseudomonadota bacterium]
MKILLTNDDGYQAPNIQNLFRKLSENHDVWIIAPENNCSGMSAAISFLKDTEIRQVEERIYAVDGTPADCTYFGLLGIVDFEFDMVVSGINHGANLGTDVIYSGTVGAAVGGRKLKYPPLALSVASYETVNMDFIVNKTSKIIDTIKSLPEQFHGKVFNVNFPDLSEDECKGIQITSLAKRGVPSKPIVISSDGDIKKYRYNLSGEPVDEPTLTDARAVKDGYISISILDYDLDQEPLRENLKSFFNE